jgi:Na+/proline symporter
VLKAAQEQGKLNLFPHVTTAAWLVFIGEFLTMALGSIPQQDVFQRVTSAKSEQTAFIGTLCGGLFYFAFAFVPMFIAFSATVIDPSYTELFAADDPREVQKILPTLILNKTPIWCQVLFFGAVLSAILSTASGTLLAPASVLTENVLQPVLKHFSDKTLLWILRMVLVLVAVAGTLISVSSNKSMYEMVEMGYSVTLVMAFVPLVAGIYWSRASTQGAIFSIGLSLAVWLTVMPYHDEESGVLWQLVPPQLYGLCASFVGMFVGSLLPQWIKQSRPDPEGPAHDRKPIAGH